MSNGELPLHRHLLVNVGRYFSQKLISVFFISLVGLNVCILSGIRQVQSIDTDHLTI
jgi:hypothetical protein